MTALHKLKFSIVSLWEEWHFATSLQTLTIVCHSIGISREFTPSELPGKLISLWYSPYNSAYGLSKHLYIIFSTDSHWLKINEISSIRLLRSLITATKSLITGTGYVFLPNFHINRWTSFKRWEFYMSWHILCSIISCQSDSFESLL